MEFKPGYRGFLAFARTVGADLKPFTRRNARAHVDAEREVVAILPPAPPLAALIAVHHVLTVPNPQVYIGSASREMTQSGPAVLTVLAASGDKAHGHPRPTLYIDALVALAMAAERASQAEKKVELRGVAVT